MRLWYCLLHELPRLFAAGAVASLLAACTQSHVAVTQPYAGGSLKWPERVLVQDFAIDPSEVRLDQGVNQRRIPRSG